MKNLAHSTKRDLFVEAPFFLVGPERGGTTLLRLMLDSHPEICWLKEFEYAVDLISKDNQYPPLEEFKAHLEYNRIFKSTCLKIVPNLSYPELIRSFLQQKKAETGKPIVGATVHRNFEKLKILWPNAKYIHLIRDPRDVSRSVIEMGWAGNSWSGSAKWIEAHESWEKTKQGISVNDYHCLKFEDLIINPQKELEKIANFCGVPYTNSMMEYDKNTTYAKPDSRMVYSWKRKASKLSVQLVEARVGELLSRYGYEPSGHASLKLNVCHRMALSLQDKVGKWRFRLKRYGFWLLAKHWVARRIHLTGLRNKTLLEINRIDTLYLK